MRILGFDVSSTCIGYAVVDFHPATKEMQYVDSGYLKPDKKIKNILLQLKDTRDKIEEIITEYEPEEIAIEDIIQFMQGKSTAKTIIKLTSFNRMIGLLCLDLLDQAPTMHNVNSIRSSVRKHLVTTSGYNKEGKIDKEELPELIAQIFHIQFPWEHKKTGTLKMENYDRSDAMCVAFHHVYKKYLQPAPSSAKKRKKAPTKAANEKKRSV